MPKHSRASTRRQVRPCSRRGGGPGSRSLRRPDVARPGDPNGNEGRVGRRVRPKSLPPSVLSERLSSPPVGIRLHPAPRVACRCRGSRGDQSEYRLAHPDAAVQCHGAPDIGCGDDTCRGLRMLYRMSTGIYGQPGLRRFDQPFAHARPYLKTLHFGSPYFFETITPMLFIVSGIKGLPKSSRRSSRSSSSP
jgi:hypothetical protein